MRKNKVIFYFKKYIIQILISYVQSVSNRYCKTHGITKKVYGDIIYHDTDYYTVILPSPASNVTINS